MPLGEHLEGDDPFDIGTRTPAEARDAKKEIEQAALAWAQKYLVFQNGAAKEILDFWLQKVRNQKIAPSAPATEFAYFTGVREFVEGINLQIEFAKNGGKSPYAER
jgi:hypothetical protein